MRRTCGLCPGRSGSAGASPGATVELGPVHRLVHRGTQLSVVGYTTVGLCRACDADDLAAALRHGGVVLPKELPTVDPQTLRELGRGVSTPEET